MNFLTEEDDLDLFDDNIILVTASEDEAGAGVAGRINTNTVLTKVGQTILLSNVNSIRERA